MMKKRYSDLQAGLFGACCVLVFVAGFNVVDIFNFIF